MNKIRIIGVGAMGEGIASRLASSHHLTFFDKNREKAEAAAHKWGGTHVTSAFEGLTSETIVLLAIKPQDFLIFIQEAKKNTFSCRYLVSILTGIPLSAFKEHLPKLKVLRMMPNLAVRCGEGIVALAETPEMENLKSEVESLFSSLGLCMWLPESKFDAVTSLTGSGPGFACALIESMIDAAIAMGFSYQEAYPLVLHMLRGTVTLLQESKEVPSALKWQVTSPRGTTIEGLRKLEEKGVRSGIIETFLTAYSRAQELAKKEI